MTDSDHCLVEIEVDNASGKAIKIRRVSETPGD
jgi:hypothetical protein